MDQWDRDELELGRRAATWQLHDELGQLYPELEDRAWNVVIGCYGLLCDLPAPASSSTGASTSTSRNDTHATSRHTKPSSRCTHATTAGNHGPSR
jgi:hypothetical protein